MSTVPAARAGAERGCSDYSTVTESPGTQVSPEAVEMVRTRYAFAASHGRGRAVLEVACGPGPGLGMLAAHCRRVVAGDYTESLLGLAHAHYGSRVPLLRLDATHLPFAPSSFDVIVLFEAIYFLPDFAAFLDECRRVLTTGGALLLVTVNPEWDAFNPSPFAIKYWSAGEITRACHDHGFAVDLSAGFPAESGGLRGRLVSSLKRGAVSLNLMPKTMKGKELLKRFAFGRLEPFPTEVSIDGSPAHPLVRLTDLGVARKFKVLYAVARKERP